MKNFMDENFLLENKICKKLYFNYASKMPIIDYHCHIAPKDIALNKTFSSISELWLKGDHYKWRLMRANGICEKYITGKGSDYEKFYYFIKTLEKAIGNPVYHWSYLELKRYFNYEGPLNTKTAKDVFDLCNNKLKTMTAKKIISDSNVDLLCTTDDPLDDLKYHDLLKDDKDFKTVVLPAFRPDQIINIEKTTFKVYISKLSKVAFMEINSIDDLLKAIDKRLEYFLLRGCLVADHGLDYLMYEEYEKVDINNIFKKALDGEKLDQKEIDAYKTFILLYLSKQYHSHNIVMQLHFGCLRNNNSLISVPDTGYDSINNYGPANKMVKLIDHMNKNGLPKLILYSLNPNDNELIDSIIGCFQNDDCPGKIQHGSAWWFNDNKNGIIRHLDSLASGGLLGNFIGMLTDSRSFISYPRHEYFRRILCNYIGTLVKKGEYFYDEENLKELVEDISYNNALRYFGFDKYLNK